MAKKRINILINPEQIDFLRNYPSKTLSEHIRLAIDNYIWEIKQKSLNVSSSKSEQIKHG